MAGYIGSRASVVSSGAERKKTFDITGTTTVLTGLSYTPTFVHLFHNGVRLVDGTDYTATNGTSITLTTAAQSGDQVVVVSYATFQAADAYTKAEADAGFVSDPNGAVTVDGSGNVGIGTAVPSTALEVSTAGTTNKLRVSNSSGSKYGEIYTDTNGVMIVDANADATGGAPNLRFKVSGTERMRIDTAGRVTMPYQPAFFAKSSAANNTGAAGFQIFGNVQTNIGGHFSAATGRFTAPVSGMYHFSATVLSRANAHIRLDFAKNSVLQTYTESTQAEYNYTFATQTLSIYLSAGDYASVTSGAISTYGGVYNYFSGHLIG